MTYDNFEEKNYFLFPVLFKAENPMKYYTFLNHVTDSFSQKIYLDNIGTLFYFTILSFSGWMLVFFENILLTFT